MVLNKLLEISGQDGGEGRHTEPPCTTKRRTTNLKTKNNQNWQKIELYGNPTTKELKKNHSSRQVGGLGQARLQLVDWVVPHLHADKLERTTGERDRPHNPGF